jgi:hypothetical protein
VTSSEAEWLALEDQVCRSDRIRRLQWLEQSSPEVDWVRFSGWSGKSLYEECRYCFAYGQFIAAILLGLAFVERALASDFFAAGRDDLERAPIGRLLKEAELVGWLSAAGRQKLDDLRDERNRLTHFRRPYAEGSIERRAVALEMDPYDLVEQDAHATIEVVNEILAAS